MDKDSFVKVSLQMSSLETETEALNVRSNDAIITQDDN